MYEDNVAISRAKSWAAFPYVCNLPGEESVEQGLTKYEWAFFTVLSALISNPARYEDIKSQLEKGILTQDEATAKNINKARLIVEAALIEINK